MKLRFPVNPPYTISQNFGLNLRDYGQFNLKGHNGIDIAVPLGTPALAVTEGEIASIETKYTLQDDHDAKKGYGNFVRLFCPQSTNTGMMFDCVYAHLAGISVKIGQRVGEGDLIGHVDSTGYSTGHHLHFGVREWYDGKLNQSDNGYSGYLNPLLFFENVKEEFPMDYRYGQERSLKQEWSWNILNGSYAKRKAILRGIRWDDRYTKIFVYGHWPLEWGFHQSDAIKAIVYEMTKMEYEKRLGKKIAPSP